MFNVHKEEYKIDGKSVTSVVDFLKDKVYIYSRGVKLEFDLADYTNFEGNMKDFVAYYIRQ